MIPTVNSEMRLLERIFLEVESWVILTTEVHRVTRSKVLKFV